MTADRPPDSTRIKADIRKKAAEIGFEAVGFSPAELPAEAGRRLRTFLARGMHGDMGWLAATADRRADPRARWPNARSVIVLGANYGPPGAPFASRDPAGTGAISIYAQGADYHDVLKKRLRGLARWITETFGTEVRAFVDTAAVMEKPLAEAAGIGWQGKHTNLVSREFGSWLFLAILFTALDLPADPPGRDRCGKCRNCLDSCPTDAFPQPYVLDARRCISYLTIEHKGQIAREFREKIGNRIYGCDDCLAVCPWNKFARAAAEIAFHARPEIAGRPLAELADLDDASFRRRFRGSPVKRIGRDRFVRNVLIALGNSGDRGLLGAVEKCLEDTSPLVRGMAVWAYRRLAPAHDASERKRLSLARESDEAVRDEWSDQ